MVGRMQMGTNDVHVVSAGAGHVKRVSAWCKFGSTMQPGRAAGCSELHSAALCIGRSAAASRLSFPGVEQHVDELQLQLSSSSIGCASAAKRRTLPPACPAQLSSGSSVGRSAAQLGCICQQGGYQALLEAVHEPEDVRVGGVGAVQVGDDLAE